LGKFNRLGFFPKDSVCRGLAEASGTDHRPQLLSTADAVLDQTRTGRVTQVLSNVPFPTTPMLPKILLKTGGGTSIYAGHQGREAAQEVVNDVCHEVLTTF
jgi:hypothetical protein